MNSLEHPECTSIIRHRGLARAAEKVRDSSRGAHALGGSRVWWSLVAEPAKGSWQLCHLYQVCVQPRHPAVSPWNRLTSSSSRGQILCDLPLLPRWQSPICEEQGPPRSHTRLASRPSCASGGFSRSRGGLRCVAPGHHSPFGDRK